MKRILKMLFMTLVCGWVGCSESESTTSMASLSKMEMETGGVVKSSNAGKEIKSTPVDCDVSESAKSAETSVAKEPCESIMERMSRFLAEGGLMLGYSGSGDKARFVSKGFASAVDVRAEEVNEALRQRVFKTAVDRSVAEIAKCLGKTLLASEETTTEPGEGNERRKEASQFSSMVRMPLKGVTILTAMESYNPTEKTYEVAVATGWSKKLENEARAIVGGGVISVTKPSGSSIRDWVEKHLEDGWLLGGRRVVDDMGDIWVVGSVSIDDSMAAYLDDWMEKSGESNPFMGRGVPSEGSKHKEYVEKMYALAAATRLMWCDVDSRIMLDVHRDGDKMEESIKEELKVAPLLKLHVEDGCMKWFRRKAVSPVSMKEVELLLVAIRCNDIRVGEKKTVGL